MARAEPWRIEKSGLVLRVRVTPRSSRNAIEGVETTADGPALKARVRAVPADGKANDALEHLIADWIGVPRRAVALSSGGKSRVKLMAVSGDPVALSALVRTRLEAMSAS